MAPVAAGYVADLRGWTVAQTQYSEDMASIRFKFDTPEGRVEVSLELHAPRDEDYHGPDVLRCASTGEMIEALEAKLNE